MKSKPTKGPKHQDKQTAIASVTRLKKIRENEASHSHELRSYPPTRVSKRMAAEQGGRLHKPAMPSRVPEAPAPLPTKKAKYEPAAAPKRSGRATSSKGRSSGRAPKLFAVTDVS